MSKLSQQDLNKLKTLAKKLNIADPIEQALVNDANRGIALSGATGKFQQQLHRQAKALSHIEQALSLLDKDQHIKKTPVAEVSTIDDSKSSKNDFSDNTLRSIEIGKYYSLILHEVPKSRKIAILKMVMTLTRSGLREAKEIVESTPCPLFDRLSSEKTAQIVTKLETVGATVKIAVSPAIN